MKAQRPTMQDVAAAAGVSLKTVSRVVNGEPGVRRSTALRVQAAIAELGYRPNDVARSLRARSAAASIGLVIGDVANPFYSAIARAVEVRTRRAGSVLVTASSGEDPDQEREVVEMLLARRVDGLLLVPAAGDHGWLAEEMRRGVRVVFLDRLEKTPDGFKVFFFFRHGASFVRYELVLVVDLIRWNQGLTVYAQTLPLSSVPNTTDAPLRTHSAPDDPAAWRWRKVVHGDATRPGKDGGGAASRAFPRARDYPRECPQEDGGRHGATRHAACYGSRSASHGALRLTEPRPACQSSSGSPARGVQRLVNTPRAT
jgi:transcriptional regulator with XRE-family HTH domain